MTPPMESSPTTSMGPYRESPISQHVGKANSQGNALSPAGSSRNLRRPFSLGDAVKALARAAELSPSQPKEANQPPSPQGTAATFTAWGSSSNICRIRRCHPSPAPDDKLAIVIRIERRVGSMISLFSCFRLLLWNCGAEGRSEKLNERMMYAERIFAEPSA